jgi:hypothetical protein
MARAPPRMQTPTALWPVSSLGSDLSNVFVLDVAGCVASGCMETNKEASKFKTAVENIMLSDGRRNVCVFSGPVTDWTHSSGAIMHLMQAVFHTQRFVRVFAGTSNPGQQKSVLAIELPKGWPRFGGAPCGPDPQGPWGVKITGAALSWTVQGPKYCRITSRHGTSVASLRGGYTVLGPTGDTCFALTARLISVAAADGEHECPMRVFRGSSTFSAPLQWLTVFVSMTQQEVGWLPGRIAAVAYGFKLLLRQPMARPHGMTTEEYAEQLDILAEPMAACVGPCNTASPTAPFPPVCTCTTGPAACSPRTTPSRPEHVLVLDTAATASSEAPSATGAPDVTGLPHFPKVPDLAAALQEGCPPLAPLTASPSASPMVRGGQAGAVAGERTACAPPNFSPNLSGSSMDTPSRLGRAAVPRRDTSDGCKRGPSGSSLHQSQVKVHSWQTEAAAIKAACLPVSGCVRAEKACYLAPKEAASAQSNPRPDPLCGLGGPVAPFRPAQPSRWVDSTYVGPSKTDQNLPETEKKLEWNGVAYCGNQPGHVALHGTDPRHGCQAGAPSARPTATPSVSRLGTIELRDKSCERPMATPAALRTLGATGCTPCKPTAQTHGFPDVTTAPGPACVSHARLSGGVCSADGARGAPPTTGPCVPPVSRPFSSGRELLSAPPPVTHVLSLSKVGSQTTGGDGSGKVRLSETLSTACEMPAGCGSDVLPTRVAEGLARDPAPPGHTAPYTVGNIPETNAPLRGGVSFQSLFTPSGDGQRRGMKRFRSASNTGPLEASYCVCSGAGAKLDPVMVHCSSRVQLCGGFVHPRCMGTTYEAVRSTENYVCPLCCSVSDVSGPPRTDTAMPGKVPGASAPLDAGAWRKGHVFLPKHRRVNLTTDAHRGQGKT